MAIARDDVAQAAKHAIQFDAHLGSGSCQPCRRVTVHFARLILGDFVRPLS
jgi:NADH:ubiquinone oxidoreductase subunit F (NADH-binding)